MYADRIGIQQTSGIPGVDDKDMRSAFRAIDFDKDGQISSKDVKIFLEAMGEQPTDAEINEMIRMGDQGKDGLIHLSEFCDLFRSKTSNGHPNDVFNETCKIMANLRLDVKKGQSTFTPDEILKRFVSRLPGSINGKPFIKRDALKEIIARWKTMKVDQVREREFYELLRIKKNDNTERAYSVIVKGADFIDIKTFILILGGFVNASCEERIDFACRIIDDTNTGMLSEEHIEKIIAANCIGIKGDLRTRVEKVMRDSDANSMVSRKHLIQIAQSNPITLFPGSRIDYPSA